MSFRILLAFLLLGVAFAAPVSVSACPLCKEAISTTDDPDEVNNLPAAYNNSIYMMVAVPYLSLGLLGFGIYRGLKKNAEYFENLHGDESRGQQS